MHARYSRFSFTFLRISRITFDYAIQILITPRHFKYFTVSYAAFNFLIQCLNAFFAGKTRGQTRPSALCAIAICANVFFVSSSNFCNILQNPTDCTSSTLACSRASNTASSLSNKSHNFFRSCMVSSPCIMLYLHHLLTDACKIRSTLMFAQECIISKIGHWAYY